MRFGPPFDYARRQDGRRVAYQVVGGGDLDLVFLFGWPTHLGLMWENPSFAGFLNKLASFSRLILYDRVGGGLSDRGGAAPGFEDEMDDLQAVLAAVGSERAALFGCHSGGRLALLLALIRDGETFDEDMVLSMVAPSEVIDPSVGIPDDWQLYAVELAEG
jgi:pimeloyl-ACP methyl ester carboxylesterase